MQTTYNLDRRSGHERRKAAKKQKPPQKKERHLLPCGKGHWQRALMSGKVFVVFMFYIRDVFPLSDFNATPPLLSYARRFPSASGLGNGSTKNLKKKLVVWERTLAECPHFGTVFFVFMFYNRGVHSLSDFYPPPPPSPLNMLNGSGLRSDLRLRS